MVVQGVLVVGRVVRIRQVVLEVLVLRDRGITVAPVAPIRVEVVEGLMVLVLMVLQLVVVMVVLVET
jgi:hypothetical protein